MSEADTDAIVTLYRWLSEAGARRAKAILEQQAARAELERLASVAVRNGFSVPEVARITGLSRQSVYALLKSFDQNSQAVSA